MVFRHPPGRVAVMQPDVIEPPAPSSGDQPRALRRLADVAWAAPLGVHAFLLLIALLVILPFTESGPVWLADEGGMRLEAELLAEGEPWALGRPFAGLDPEEVTVPIESATINGDRYTPFAKHVAASLLLGGAVRALGSFGFIALSILATAAAGWIVGATAERLRRGSGRWALWAIGLGGPLVIYSYTSTSHTIGVALAAAAVAAAIGVLQGRLWWAVPLIAAVALGPQFRNEALLFGGAVAFALVLFSIRPVHLGRIGIAAAVGLAAVAGFGANLLFEQRVAGSLSVPVDTTAPCAIERIVNAGSTVLLRVTDDPIGIIAVYGLAAFTVLLIVWLRVDQAASGRHVFHAVAAMVSAAVLLVVGPVHVYGILLAFPLLVGGLAAIRSEVWSSPRYRFLLLIAGVYAVAVLITQDFGGGGVQWGGRYLFVALPAAVPPAIAAISAAVERIDRRTASVVIAAIVIGAAAMTVTSVRLIADRHTATVGVVNELADAATVAGPAGDGGGPVVFSPFTNVGRLAWETVGDTRYLLMPEDDVMVYIDRFSAAPIERFVLLASSDDEVDRFEANGFVVSDEIARIGPGRLVEMERVPTDD